MAIQIVDQMKPAPPGDDRSLGAIARNENGAMLVMGIFMVMFIAALLYYVVGIGDTVTYRERMQDAADAGAMTGSIFLARGMNIITLMNLTLASVFGVLLAARAAYYLLYAASAAAGAQCETNPAACVASICYLLSVPAACDAIDEAKDIVDDAADATTSIQESARDNTALAATAAVAQLGTEHYSPPVQAPLGALGAYGMVTDPLPVERDPNPPICTRTVNPIPNERFAAGSLVANSYNAYDLAKRLRKGCSRTYLDEVALSAPFWVGIACAVERSEVKRDLFRVKRGANLGDENFQFHTLMVGTPPYGLGNDNAHAERVSVGTWGNEAADSGGKWGALQQLSRFAVAQGEFLFDADEPREDWLWELRWRARLRRFRCSDSRILDAVCVGALENAFIH